MKILKKKQKKQIMILKQKMMMMMMMMKLMKKEDDAEEEDDNDNDDDKDDSVARDDEDDNTGNYLDVISVKVYLEVSIICQQMKYRFCYCYTKSFLKFNDNMVFPCFKASALSVRMIFGCFRKLKQDLRIQLQVSEVSLDINAYAIVKVSFVGRRPTISTRGNQYLLTLQVASIKITSPYNYASRIEEG
ncbi:MAG: hypothetical protein EZS28_038413 [Streblomastix strix]|uniref:Uncharacterized protein n=1 Tax=Streblomastix strix TaxID=222440 RepID=A0A5J4U737_9EUKA|nr:MAG: hypothetical protein EZS28_038413 [Streblomastix strix]